MRFNHLVKPLYQNSHFSAIQNLDFLFYIFSYIGGPKVDMCYSDFLLAKSKILDQTHFLIFYWPKSRLKRFGPNPFSHFLLAENGHFHPTRPLFDPGHYWQCLKRHRWRLDQVFMACMLFITHYYFGHVTCLDLPDQTIVAPRTYVSRPLHLESWHGGDRKDNNADNADAV